ncbi:uncharacterized protein LOC125462219 [Stegostoma tigrinum]|uniref:uncharacterized protein LOC125462219 n=1 Tax=Stegostoma tigrinum TaxID=3053191 RepID=UPI00286FF5A5|nr:uncharacterized protein LOC125462219 [Stegostoma tigrinum]
MSVANVFPVDAVTLVLLGVLTIIILLYFNNGLKTPGVSNFPPGPPPLPLIGNLHMLDLKRLNKSLMKLSEKYGKVFSVKLGSTTTVVLTGYEAVKDALVNNADEFAERAHLPIFEENLKGHGLIFGHGESWKQMRRFTLITLRNFGMGKKTIEDKIIEESDFLVKMIDSHKGQPFNPTLQMSCVVANVICSIVFGDRFDYEDEKFVSLIKRVNENIQLIGSPIVHVYNAFPLLRFLPGLHNKVFTNVEQNVELLKGFFKENRQKFDCNDLRSFIDAFMFRQQKESDNPNSYFHEDNLMYTTMHLFAAGMETISATLRWGMLLMMKYPEIQKKVHEEITRVIGSERPPRIEDRKDLPYTDAVIHEIQRFGDIAPLSIPRETTVDVNFRGYFIPKGTQVIPLLSSVLYDKTQWEKPDEFNPSHFLNAEGKFVKRDAFMPFSAGRRTCTGETLAKMELFLFFTILIQKFMFQVPPNVSELKLESGVGGTSFPKYPYVCASWQRASMPWNTVSSEPCNSACHVSARALWGHVPQQHKGKQHQSIARASDVWGSRQPEGPTEWLRMSVANVFPVDAVTLVLLGALTIIILLYFNNGLKTPGVSNFPPGPPPLPLIGNLHMLDLKKLSKSLMKLSEKYGKVFSIKLGPTTTVVLTGYEAVKDALENNADAFGERARIPIFEALSKGHGIVFGHGESWKQMRRFALTTLRDFGMGRKTMEDKIIEESDFLVEVIDSYEGQPFNPTFQLNSAAANIIGSLVFGDRFNYEDEGLVGLLKRVNENVQLLGSPIIQLCNVFPLLRYLPGPHNKVLINAEKTVNFFNGIFKENLQKLDKNHLRSFIDLFKVRQQKESDNPNSYFHQDNLTYTTMHLFAAGMESISATLHGRMLLMMKYPEIQKKVHEEITRVIGSERPPRVEDRKNLPYTYAVIHEIQRFGDIVPLGMTHETTVDVNFRGYFIPKGTHVIPMLTSVLHDKTQWEKPDEFNPSHFLNAEGKFAKRDAFMPFSAVRRICAGESLAKMELFLFFTTLIQKFKFQVPPDVSELELESVVGATSFPKYPYVCAVRR